MTLAQMEPPSKYGHNHKVEMTNAALCHDLILNYPHFTWEKIRAKEKWFTDAASDGANCQVRPIATPESK